MQKWVSLVNVVWDQLRTANHSTQIASVTTLVLRGETAAKISLVPSSIMHHCLHGLGAMAAVISY